MKKNKVNPLNVLEIRRVSFPAKHFTYCEEKYHPTQFKLIDQWIYQNLNSRYYMGKSISLVDNTIDYVAKIGFEEPKELSFFKLACPHLSTKIN